MLVADVNIFVTAHRIDDPHQREMSRWLAAALSGAEQFGVSEFVLSAFVRVVTNRRSFEVPATPEEALAFCSAVRGAPAARIVVPGPRHWEIFDRLVRETHATANLVPDAYLAALALENGATFVTRDHGFARYPGLRRMDPLAG